MLLECIYWENILTYFKILNINYDIFLVHSKVVFTKPIDENDYFYLAKYLSKLFPQEFLFQEIQKNKANVITNFNLFFFLLLFLRLFLFFFSYFYLHFCLSIIIIVIMDCILIIIHIGRWRYFCFCPSL